MSDTTNNQIYRTPDGVWYQKRSTPFGCTGCMFQEEDDCRVQCDLTDDICLPYRPADDLARIADELDRLDAALTEPDYPDEYRLRMEQAGSAAARVRAMVEELFGRME